MTLQSRTSVALLRILLETHYGVKPEYVDGSIIESGDDACLLIGDMALEENEKCRFPFSYDLGTLWQDWQGLPFVFGAWIIAKEAMSRELGPTLEQYMEATERSIEVFGKNISAALDAWLAKYPVSLPRKVMVDYYRVLDYRFTDERKESLALFLDLAARMGLCEHVHGLEYL